MTPDEVFHRKPDGTIIASAPFIAWCGCGSINHKLEVSFKNAGYERSKVPQFKSRPKSSLAHQFLDQHGYSKRIPELAKSEFAILINPKTKEYLNLLKENTKEVSNGIEYIFSR